MKLLYVAEEDRHYDKRTAEEISMMLGVPVVKKEISFPRPTSKSLESIARERVAYAHSQFERPLIVEESSVELKEGVIYIAGEGRMNLKPNNGAEVLARIALAYACEENIVVFEGDIPGKVARIPAGDSGTWWDTQILPRGYQNQSKHRTFAELISLPHVFDKRMKQYLALADYLELPGARDIYEAHLTVPIQSHSAWEEFKELCDEIGIKAIQIQLPEGEHPRQLITGSFHRGNYDKVRKEVFDIGQIIENKGYDVTRHKIEAWIRHNEHVPQTDEEARAKSPANYFEFHVKVRRPLNEDISDLQRICNEFGVHLSRSASNRVGSTEQRFITARYYLVGKATAEELFQRLLDRLERNGETLTNILKEYTLFDDNLELDRGWADSSPCEQCETECPFEG